MSTPVEVAPGAQIVLDPSDARVIRFNFDRYNLPDGVTLVNTSPLGITVEALKQNGPTALTYDNDSLITSSRSVQARFLATTASPGDRYRVSVSATTDEVPAQTKEYSIDIRIEDR